MEKFIYHGSLSADMGKDRQVLTGPDDDDPGGGA